MYLGVSFAFIAAFNSPFILARSGGGAASVDDHLAPVSAHLRAHAEQTEDVDNLKGWRRNSAIVCRVGWMQLRLV